jgi:hypothetical protein
MDYRTRSSTSLISILTNTRGAPEVFTTLTGRSIDPLVLLGVDSDDIVGCVSLHDPSQTYQSSHLYLIAVRCDFVGTLYSCSLAIYLVYLGRVNDASTIGFGMNMAGRLELNGLRPHSRLYR